MKYTKIDVWVKVYEALVKVYGVAAAKEAIRAIGDRKTLSRVCKKTEGIAPPIAPLLAPVDSVAKTSEIRPVVSHPIKTAPKKTSEWQQKIIGEVCDWTGASETRSFPKFSMVCQWAERMDVSDDVRKLAEDNFNAYREYVKLTGVTRMSPIRLLCPNGGLDTEDYPTMLKKLREDSLAGMAAKSAAAAKPGRHIAGSNYKLKV